MSTYVIGDIQGCYTELLSLLGLIHFNSEKDQLWFVGDLVNRGKHSLEVLRFIKDLGQDHVVVLGNHDLHLLAVAEGINPLRAAHTFQDVLNAPDRDELIFWLRQQKFLHYDAKLNAVMTHAGIYPRWSLQEAVRYAQEVENILRGDSHQELLKQMYGNAPDIWGKNLKDMDRYRFIINVFTRMRYCDLTGRLNFSEKGSLSEAPGELLPWFKVPNRACREVKIIFGHWAALSGVTNEPNVFAVDTGCSWGQTLTAHRIEDGQQFSVRKFPLA